MAPRTLRAKRQTAGGMSMDASARAPLWIAATGVIVVALYFFREPLTQFALALILWLAIDGLARFLDAKIPFTPRWLALPIALVLVLSLVSLTIFVISRNLGIFATEARGYGVRLNEIVAQAHAALGLRGEPPTVDVILARINPTTLVREIGSAVQSVAADTVFILIFLAFLFSAAGTFSKKLDYIFADPRERARAAEVFASIRVSMERYIWLQTVVSLITCALTYPTLLLIGLDNALFWTFLIFFLNYIPTIGSIIAVALPTAFALVQFPNLLPVAATAVGIGAWQFIVGNFVYPRMAGETLNLSTVVVLLSLALWGVLWGLAGAFLSAPLTVMLMIVLAQFESTRWIAILLSQDGRPTKDTAVAK
jgi:predicted PurR-regulated permease PerM